MPALLPFCQSLAASPRAADRALWLRIAADVLARGEPELVDAQFEADFLAAVAKVDEATRLALVERFGDGARVSVKLVKAFIERADSAAVWMVKHAPILTSELIALALEEPRQARALAERADLKAETIEALALSDNAAVLFALARNRAVEFGPGQLTRLVEWARDAGDASLAAALLARTPMRAECAPLFLQATTPERAQILIAVQRAELGRARPLPVAEADADTQARLEYHALEGRDDLLAAELAAALDAPLDLARRLLADKSGEPLAVALAALRAPNDVMVRILTALDLGDGSEYRRLGALARLHGALNPTAAAGVIACLAGLKLARVAAPLPSARRPVPVHAEPGRASAKPAERDEARDVG